MVLLTSETILNVVSNDMYDNLTYLYINGIDIESDSTNHFPKTIVEFIGTQNWYDNIHK